MAHPAVLSRNPHLGKRNQRCVSSPLATSTPRSSSPETARTSQDRLTCCLREEGVHTSGIVLKSRSLLTIALHRRVIPATQVRKPRLGGKVIYLQGSEGLDSGQKAQLMFWEQGLSPGFPAFRQSQQGVEFIWMLWFPLSHWLGKVLTSLSGSSFTNTRGDLESVTKP